MQSLPVPSVAPWLAASAQAGASQVLLVHFLAEYPKHHRNKNRRALDLEAIGNDTVKNMPVSMVQSMDITIRGAKTVYLLSNGY